MWSTSPYSHLPYSPVLWSASWSTPAGAAPAGAAPAGSAQTERRREQWRCHEQSLEPGGATNQSDDAANSRYPRICSTLDLLHPESTPPLNSPAILIPSLLFVGNA